MMKNTSEQLFARAKKTIAGGVNSPARAFAAVGGSPIFFQRGEGAYLIDADGKRYIDYVCSWGALIAGHARAEVLAAVAVAAKNGLGFGAPTAIEIEFAETIAKAMPSLEKMRAVNSGTEAAMSAIRLARGFTNRNLLVKFEGCYHGHADCLLVAAGSGALTLGIPSSGGVPPSAASDTLILPYGDINSLRRIFAEKNNEIAAVIVEPIAGNMNMIIPSREFLLAIRECCDSAGSLLIFDEVMTGFRVGRGGGQERFGIRPDLTCLGKVAGGGLPAAVFGGRSDVMNSIAPDGKVYQAGTLSGNPIALSAGLATLKIALADGFFGRISQTANNLAQGLNEVARRCGVAFCAQSAGGMIGIYFRESPPQNFDEVKKCNANQFRRFFHLMLKEGIYLAPSPFEANFIGDCHGEEEIAKTLAAAEKSLREISDSQ